MLYGIATVGWALVLYLARQVFVDSWDRTMFSLAVLDGKIPELDPFNERYRLHPWQTWAHTIPGLVFSILGPMRFMLPILDRFRVIHRTSGRIFLPFGILSGLAAIVIGLGWPTWESPCFASS